MDQMAPRRKPRQSKINLRQHDGVTFCRFIRQPEQFPLMSADELKTLADDIAKNGLQEKVAYYCEGKIRYLLDGRNRADALEMLGRRDHFDDAHTINGDPFAYVISKNIHRRHLMSRKGRNCLSRSSRVHRKNLIASLARKLASMARRSRAHGRRAGRAAYSARQNQNRHEGPKTTSTEGTAETDHHMERDRIVGKLLGKSDPRTAVQLCRWSWSAGFI